MDKQRGHYLGTEIDGKWWRRHRKNHFLARGLGEWWQDEEGLYFLRYLTKEPIFIPFSLVKAVKTGKWHAGRRAAGKEIVKVFWQSEGQSLCSGFVVPGGKEEAHPVGFQP